MIVVGLVLGVPRIDDESAQLYLYAGVVVLGTLVQLLLPIPWLRRLDGRLTVVIDWRDPAVKRVLVLMLPVTLTIGLDQRQLPRRHAVRVAAARSGARAGGDRQGLPPLHAPAGRLRRRRHDGALPDARATRRARRHRPDCGARSTAACARSRSCSFPAGLVSIVLAEPIVRLVYQRGEFTAEDTVIVAQCLQAFSIGLVFNGWMLILNRSFYAVQTNWVPTGIALGAVALNAAFDTVFYRLGIWGIPLATSTVNVVAATVLLVMMRRRVGLEHVGRTLGVVGARGRRRSASPPACVVGAGTGSTRCSATGVVAQLVSLGAGLAVGGLVYLALARALGLRELEALLLLRARRDEPSDRSAEPPYAARPHSQLRDHRAHRPRQVDARRSHPRADRRGHASARCASSCSTRWTSSASAGSRSRRRPCACHWRGHQLNLIDTPGHVDFTYEVSRSLQACEGALLVVDAAQGIEAQTLANAYLAIDGGLEIVPAANKIDLPQADPGRRREGARRPPRRGARPRAADLGEDRRRRPRGARRDRRAHPGAGRRPGRARARPRLRLLVRPVPRRRRVRARRRRNASRRASRCARWRRAPSSTRRRSASCRPPARPSDSLSAGEVGYVITGLKDVSRLRVGDTLTSRRRPAAEPLPGYQDVKPMVFAGIFPTDSDDYPELRDALERLKLNDGSLSYEPETSQALGFGFRCGFLGLLHMEIVRERLEREFDLDLLITAPNVAYRATTRTGEQVEVHNPAEMPRELEEVEEPYVEGVGDRPEGLRRRRHGARERAARELRPPRVPERGSRAARCTSCRSARSCSTSTTS